MQPYYEEDGIQIWLGDCRDILPSLPKVDSVVTDPPYGISYDGVHAQGRRKYRGRRIEPSRFGDAAKIVGDDEVFDFSPIQELCVPVALSGAQYLYDRLPAGGSLHCWNKKGGYKPMDQGDADMVWCSVPQASRVFDLVWRGLCRHTEMSDHFVHPTQKPVALMKWMIGLCKCEGTILDPFMGSGTTLVAAKQLNRKAIGIEIELKYVEIAIERLSQKVFEFEPV